MEAPLTGPKGANYCHLCWSQVASYHAIVPSDLCLCQLCFQKTLPMTGLDWPVSTSAAALRDEVWEPGSHPTDDLAPEESWTSWFPWKRVPLLPYPHSFSVPSGLQEEARTMALSAGK